MVPAELEHLPEADRRVDIVLDDQHPAGCPLDAGRPMSLDRPRSLERKRDRERRTLVWTAALRVDRTAMHLDQTLDEREAQAETALATIEAGVCLREWFEQMRQHLRRNSLTRVLHTHERAPAGRVRLDRHDGLAISRREFDRILKQVADDLRKARPVAVYPDLFRGRQDLEPNSALVETSTMVFDRALRDLIQVEKLRLQLDLAAADTCNVEKIIDQPGHVSDLAVHHRLRPEGLLAARRGAIEDVDAVA